MDKFNKFLIKYTDINGERKTYMNIGFETRKIAENELRKIKEQRKKLKGMGSYLNRTKSYAVNTGKNFRIKKISVRIYPLFFPKAIGE